MPPRLDGFVLESLLGEGAAGRVYRAIRQEDGLVVAVKLLRDEVATDPVHRHRFLREARIATRVRHPDLVPVLAVGDRDGALYLVLPFIDGPSLDLLLASGPMPQAVAVRLVRSVASGLQALHGAGLVHRDVKPQNVMVGANGRAMLTDFGVARGAGDSVLTRAGTLIGTLDYLAPELIRGQPASPSSDIYALACLAYATLCGRPPFAGRSVLAVATAHLEAEPTPLNEVVPGLSDGLGWAVARGLAKDPAERPPSPHAFAALLTSASASPSEIQRAPGAREIPSKAGRPRD